MTLNLGLLLCDHVRPEFLHLGGDYPDYFATLLPLANITTFDLTVGQFPEADQCEAFITSGSRHSVYDEVDWIERFAELMREFHRSRTRTIGVCFGAQMMAHALGGKVDRSDRGWQVGVKEAIPVDAPQVLGSEPFRVIHSNADQIHDLPDTMRVIATSPTNPIEVIAVGDHFLGLQGHPEFTVEYSEALMRARRGTLIPDDIVDAGIASLALGPDRERLADVLIRFLH